jgi:hypothetical protein
MLTALIRDYQDVNTETGLHDTPRTLREYAYILGISHVSLVQIYGGQREPGAKVIRGLLRAFPHQAREITHAVTGEPELVGVA